jgi:hypothetical protein
MTAVISLERLEEVLNLLYRAHDMAESQEFKAIWVQKVKEIQRTELAETNISQQEGYLKWL